LAPWAGATIFGKATFTPKNLPQKISYLTSQRSSGQWRLTAPSTARAKTVTDWENLTPKDFVCVLTKIPTGYNSRENAQRLPRRNKSFS
jgi:hypothetical protein